MPSAVKMAADALGPTAVWLRLSDGLNPRWQRRFSLAAFFLSESGRVELCSRLRNSRTSVQNFCQAFRSLSESFGSAAASRTETRSLSISQ